MENRLKLLADILRNGRLIWHLMRDKDVSPWLKAIPLVALAYVLFPIDLLPDPVLGLGQLDDLAILFVGLKLFLQLVPPEAIEKHLRQRDSVEANYRVVQDDEDDAIPPQPRLPGA